MGRASYQYLPLTKTRFESLESGDITGKEKYEIRSRIQHTLMNGHGIWNGFAPDPDTFKIVDGPEDVFQRLDQESLQKARQFQQGMIGWLAFLYHGIESTPRIQLHGYPEFEGTHSIDRGPNIHFDFELMLEKAINKAENGNGRRVTNFELEVETEPLPDDPYEGLESDELLARFEERDPTLSGREIAYLQQQGEIDGRDWEQYNEEAYASPTERGGGMVGPDEFPDNTNSDTQ